MGQKSWGGGVPPNCPNKSVPVLTWLKQCLSYDFRDVHEKNEEPLSFREHLEDIKYACVRTTRIKYRI